MNILNTGMSEIKAADVEIFKRYDDAELVAVIHKNGFVGIYAEDGDILMQVSPLMKSQVGDATVIANRLMGL